MESTEKEMLVTIPPVYHQRCDVSGTDLRHAVQDGLDAKKLEKNHSSRHRERLFEDFNRLLMPTSETTSR